ncbi:TRAP transporter small permease [Halodesulfovibrio sp.]|jgi:TRAP-type C4-dicarboxylate transport system permease small subunit|uniref:TRAP transporter small permease n=1 Tax=Halodesulfovibrio sp. TaxID=1912772 RepID=UPI0025FB0173|nr:TRAP transporter small permease [Halodesulfovibrio sp.]MCT4534354.1 TRAP transporter small permease [Halodesulfovibrio sp.]MCT4625753.1 TRAP transporter small permease [Halodesulfovibrio sp.]
MNKSLQNALSIPWKGLGFFQKAVMATTSILIVGMICYTIIIRYVFGSDFYGSEELISMLAFWLYFMGAAQGSREKSQISADLLSCYIKNARIRGAVLLVKDAITCAICVLFTYWALQFVSWALIMNPKSPVFRLPMLIPQAAVGLGFVLMSLYHVTYFVQDAIAFIKGEKFGCTGDF